MAMNTQALLNHFTHTEIELLIRAYVKQQLSVAASGTNYATFFYSKTSNDGKWSVCSLYANPDTKTAGDILALCASESRRREDADKANRLLLIEHEPA